MESLADQALLQFYTNIDVLLVIASRFLGLFLILPIISGGNIPTIPRLAFSVFAAYMVLASGKITEVYYVDSIIGYVTLLARELLSGFVIGYIVYMIFSIMYFIGQLIDYQIGFSMVSVMDPTTQIQVPIVGNLLYLLMGMFLIKTGGLNSFISALFYSYDVLPIGAAKIVGNSSLVLQIIKLMTNYFTIAVQIALPLVGTILIVDISLGLLVKAAPSMNIFSVGMPLKLFIGLIVIYLIIPIFFDVYDMLFNEAYHSVMRVVRGMIP